MPDDKSVTPELIERAKRGDEQAISAIYDAYVDRIYRYIAYRVGTEADAEDLTTEVIVNMLERLPQYKITGAPFEAWLYRIASARVADFYRKRNRQPVTELSEDMAGSAALPEESLLEQQEVSELQAALSQLSPNEQTVLILRFVERKSHQAVASILNKQVSTIRNLQHRALAHLAELLGTEKQARHYLRGDDD